MNLGALDCFKLSYTLLMKIILTIVWRGKYWYNLKLVRVAFRCYAPKQATYTKNFSWFYGKRGFRK